jgi:competence protein ComEA
VRPVVILILALLAPPSARAAKAVDGVVNLNTAPAEVLGLLPGVGPAKAAEIVAYRKKRPFRTVDELVRIKGIGRKMVRRLRVHLAVAGPTTAAGLAGRRPETPAPAPPPRSPPPRVACAPCARPIARPRVQRRAPDGWATRGACLAAP